MSDKDKGKGKDKEREPKGCQCIWRDYGLCPDCLRELEVRR